ncbi:MAG: SDR family NAD(P)-dependent oxidoreductase [Rhizomicrobium sp.]
MPSVIVTGGSRGIGLGIAHALARSGREVVAVARRAGEPLHAAMEDVSRSGRGALRFHAADFSDIAALPALARELRKTFGAIEALVNNAGMGSGGLLATMPDGEIEQTIRLNVAAPIIFTKYIVRGMMADGGGRIVNISSVAALTGLKGLAAYSASKAALIGFTRSLGRELGPLGITVNAIAPGFVDTDLTRSMDAKQREQVVRRSALGRLVDASDVAHTVAFLLGDGARHLTGVVLPVDAGATA